MKRYSLNALKISIIYFSISFLWILLSDKTIILFINDIQTLNDIQTIKGWFFISLTSIVIYYLVNTFFKQEHTYKSSLEESCYLLSESQKIANLGSWELDLLTNRLSWSDQIYVIFGVKPQEFEASYEGFLSYVHPEDRDKVNEAYTNAIKNKNDYFVEHRIILSNGEIRYVEEKCVHKYNKENEIIKSIGTVHDITDKKLLEIGKHEQLVINTQIYEDLFVLSKSIILVINPKNGDILNANNSAIDFYGYDKPSLLSLNISDINQIPQQDIKDKINITLTKDDASHYFNFIHTLKSKEKRNVKVYSNQTMYAGKKVLLATIVDVTEEVDVKNKLVHVENEFNNIFEYANVGLLTRDINGIVLNINYKLVKLLGYDSKDEIIGNSCEGFSSNYHNINKEDLFGKITNGVIDNFSTDLVLQKKDGSYIDVFVTTNTYEVEKGVTYILTSLIDITQMKNKDTLLAQQAKKAAMGEMIENIAHQWRQPLTVISVAATNIKFKTELGTLNDEILDETMDYIENVVLQLSQTITDFRDFFKPNKKPKEFYIHDTFDKTFKLLISQFKTSNIYIIKNIDKVFLTGLENELIQVLINILNNARDELLIKDIKRKVIIIDVVNKDLHIEIFIKDNAGGISEHIINKVFKAHFTTKENSEGTGIGLYMSKIIIEEHMKGTLRVKNSELSYEGEKYKGANFIITIPKNISM